MVAWTVGGCVCERERERERETQRERHTRQSMGSGGKADAQVESSSGLEGFLEKNFEALCRSVARFTLAYIAASFVITIISSTRPVWLKLCRRANTQLVPGVAQPIADASHGY